ncbi:hypothetical protein [Methanolobus profundi]|uniref:Uncharacterized protein n=1 Tax=Methanolobus profundi TaxID=487685 RepID=A0A1I4NLB6_9EURY|nr:hypothetical protein [Methanolobus profundi]SFM16314.1 hypothetical protein SAMN04488696_0129 [Methanolobus profundi]
MIKTSDPVKNEQELYNKIDQYRKEHRTSALTTYDVQPFIETQPHDLHPDIVLKNIILGNACAWGTYDTACGHLENNIHAFRHFQVFNI